MTFEFFEALDTGRARSNNEDSVSLDEAVALAVLADGMGGYNAGEVASSMATTFIRTELGRWLREAGDNATDTEVRRALDICVDNANRAIFNAANSNPQYAGMGTTLVVAVFRDLRLLVREEEIERLVRPFAPTEADEAAHRAQFVGCVVLPFTGAIAALHEFAPVALEGVVQQVLRQVGLLRRRSNDSQVRAERRELSGEASLIGDIAKFSQCVRQGGES